MKHLNKILVIPLLIGLIFSCEQKNEIKKLDRVTELTNLVLSSVQFTSLKIRLSDLNLAGSQYVDADKNSIAIPFVGRDARKGVVAIFDENDVVKGVTEFEVLTNVASKDIYPELQNGRFNGTFVFRIGVGKMSLRLDNSKIVSSSIARMDGSALAFKCRGLDQTGGALDCAGARIENMNWWDKTWCFTDFPFCYARTVVSCIIDGCTVHYT